MEIDCTGTLLSKYFGKVFNEISFTCPNPFSSNSNKRIVREYNKKPSRYRRSSKDVVKDLRDQASTVLPFLKKKNDNYASHIKPLERNDRFTLNNSDPNLPGSPSTLDSGEAGSEVIKNGLFYLGAGVGAVGLGALAAVGFVAFGSVACSAYLLERLLCVDNEYQKELKALEVPNVYRPDIYNAMYEYRSPYRY